ncbi:MAG TPA: hypothetical protein VN253_12755 [Kofleriaceae bacterium]|nr:hypothetical protein [Kofleriaceae bacterium]
MRYLQDLVAGVTGQPFRDLLHLLTLPPDEMGAAFGLLAAIVIACELARIALGTVLTRSRVVHVTVCVLTFAFQSLLLAAVLIAADRTYGGRGWVNLGLVLALFVLWYTVGQATKLVRADSEGADLGFMAVGALITFPTGLVCAAIT